MTDPRSHKRYRTLADQYINDRKHTEQSCALCGKQIPMHLSRTSALGPTIEHRVPVRQILRQAQNQAEALNLVCNTEWWALAHSRCQSSQGGKAANETRKNVKRRRKW